MSAARRTMKLPDPVDIHRDEVDAFLAKLGHEDPSKVLRVRIHRREVQVDIPGPRADVPKVTITHQVLGREVPE